MVRLYVGLHRADTWIAKAIRWQTRSHWSHASLVWKGGTMIEALETRGVQDLRNFEEVRKYQPSQLYAIPSLTAKQAAVAWDFATRQLGKPYDYTMVLRFLTRQTEARRSSGKWFCSELVFAAVQKAGVNLLANTEPWKVAPGHLALSPLLVPVDHAD